MAGWPLPPGLVRTVLVIVFHVDRSACGALLIARGFRLCAFRAAVCRSISRLLSRDRTLIDAIGGTSGAKEPPDVRTRLRRASATTRRFVHEHEVGRKVKSYGIAAAAGAAIVGVAMGKAIAEQQEAQRRSAQTKELRALEDYIERTSRLLSQGLEEIKRGNTMSPNEYREEFRPAFMRILGQLEAGRPESPEIATRHNQLVRELQGLVAEFDTAMAKAEKATGQATGALSNA